MSTSWPRWPICDRAERERVVSCLERDVWSRGTAIDGFETAFAEFCGVRSAILVTSATEALRIVLAAQGVGPGTEVVVPALTWPSTIAAVNACGAHAIAVDVDPVHLGIAPHLVSRYITSRTRAVVAAHLYDSTADLEELHATSEAHGIALIEDCAQAHGCRWLNRHVGSIGHAGVFSFQTKKLMTCGEGGAITTDDDRLRDLCLSLRDHEAPTSNHYSRTGTNSRAPSLSAAILLAQLERLPSVLLQEARGASCFEESLPPSDAVCLVPKREQVTARSYYSLRLRVSPCLDATAIERVAQRVHRLTGAQLRRSYRPLDDPAFFQPQPAAKDAGLVSFTPADNSWRVYSQTLRLHHSHLLAPDHQIANLAREVHAAVQSELRSKHLRT